MDAPKVIARCDRCGRGFITLPAKGRMIDYYPRRDTPRLDLTTAKKCGGQLIPLPTLVEADGKG